MGIAVGEGASVTAYALDRDGDADLRSSALDALLMQAATMTEARDIARRIVSNRAERTATRIEALDVLDRNIPEAQRAAVRAQMRQFLTELLIDERNERMTAYIRQQLDAD